jgi:predicted dehydrogenase
VGRPLHIDGHFSADLSGNVDKWRASAAESPAGGMTSLGIHVVDAFIHLLGPICNVNTQSKNISIPFGIDDSTLVRMNFTGGQTGHLTTIAATSTFCRICVFCENGWVEIQDQNCLRYSYTNGRDSEKKFTGYDYPAVATIRATLEAFGRDVSGLQPFPISPAEIEHGTAVLEAIIDSAQLAQTKTVNTTAPWLVLPH